MAPQVSSNQPVLIIGAGPAGLALAQGFRKRNVPYRIFDRDADSSIRGQGWAVALQWVIPKLKANLPGDLPPLATVSHLANMGVTTQLVGYDGAGKELYNTSQEQNFLRADRQKLRDWLCNHVDIEWNKKFTRFDEGEDTVKAYFEDGTVAEGCLLVGADGANSHIRSQLVPNADLNDIAMDAVYGTLKVSRERHDEMSRDLARSVAVIQGQNVFLFIGLHHVADDKKTADWYWMTVRPHADGKVGNVLVDAESSILHKNALDWVQELLPKFQKVVQETKQENCLVLPSFLKIWSPPSSGFSSSKVTMIGDAAHKVTPLGGSGVNHATMDTVDLCQIWDQKRTIEEVLKEFDGIVVKRGQEGVKSSSTWPVLGR